MKRILLGLGAVALAVGLWLFEPWTLFTDKTINEDLPTVSAPVTTPEATPEATPAPAPSASASATSTPTPAPKPTTEVLTSGRFVDAEHGTSGTAKIIELADGRRFLRLENLDTSNGPDLHVWLSSATSGGSWFKYDDGSYLKLGELKANRGDQNYLIPAGADLSKMRSAVIWCDRFSVAFGTAPIRVA